MKESTAAETLSKADASDIVASRVAEITKEFNDGFKFLKDYPKSVTFFGSNQTKEESK